MALKDGPYIYDERMEDIRDKGGELVGRWRRADGLDAAVACSTFEALVEALTPFAEPGLLLANLLCHRGLVEPETCGRCSKVIAARKALILAGRWWKFMSGEVR